MKKQDLIYEISMGAAISPKEAKIVCASILEGIANELKTENGKFNLFGFGTFSRTERKARTGRNPRTGEAVKIEAKAGIKFKPGKTLKEIVG